MSSAPPKMASTLTGSHINSTHGTSTNSLASEKASTSILNGTGHTHHTHGSSGHTHQTHGASGLSFGSDSRLVNQAVSTGHDSHQSVIQEEWQEGMDASSALTSGAITSFISSSGLTASTSSAFTIQEESAKLERMRLELEIREREERAHVERIARERMERERQIHEEQELIARLKEQAIMRETVEKTRLEVLRLVSELRKAIRAAGYKWRESQVVISLLQRLHALSFRGSSTSSSTTVTTLDMSTINELITQYIGGQQELNEIISSSTSHVHNTDVGRHHSSTHHDRSLTHDDRSLTHHDHSSTHHDHTSSHRHEHTDTRNTNITSTTNINTSNVEDYVNNFTSGSVSIESFKGHESTLMAYMQRLIASMQSGTTSVHTQHLVQQVITILRRLTTIKTGGSSPQPKPLFGGNTEPIQPKPVEPVMDDNQHDYLSHLIFNILGRGKTTEGTTQPAPSKPDGQLVPVTPTVPSTSGSNQYLIQQLIAILSGIQQPAGQLPRPYVPASTGMTPEFTQQLITLLTTFLSQTSRPSGPVYPGGSTGSLVGYPGHMSTAPPAGGASQPSNDWLQGVLMPILEGGINRPNVPSGPTHGSGPRPSFPLHLFPGGLTGRPGTDSPGVADLGLSAVIVPIVNGDFSMVTNPGSITPGSASLPGWDIFKGSVNVTSNYPTDGGQYCVSLVGEYGAGGIQQTFSTQKGARYTVRFAIAAHPRFVGPDLVLVSVGDFTGQFLTSKSAGHGRPDWIVIIFSFTATGFHSTLRFEAHDNATLGPLVSSVVISQGVNLFPGYMLPAAGPPSYLYEKPGPGLRQVYISGGRFQEVGIMTTSTATHGTFSASSAQKADPPVDRPHVVEIETKEFI